MARLTLLLGAAVGLALLAAACAAEVEPARADEACAWCRGADDFARELLRVRRASLLVCL